MTVPQHSADGQAPGTGTRSDEPCPQGRTDYEQCFAPFRYCPVKGCGRAEGGLRLPTDARYFPVTDDPDLSFEHGVHIGRLLHAIDTQGSVLTEDHIDLLVSNAPGGNFAHGWLCEWLAGDAEQRTAMTVALGEHDEEPS